MNETMKPTSETTRPMAVSTARSARVTVARLATSAGKSSERASRATAKRSGYPPITAKPISSRESAAPASAVA